MENKQNEIKHNNQQLIQKIQNEAMAKQLDVENKQAVDQESMKKQVE